MWISSTIGLLLYCTSPNTRAAIEMEACLWRSDSPPFTCSDSAPRARVLPHPQSVALPWQVEQPPGPSPGFPQLETCRTGLGCGIFGHGSLPVHLSSHLGSALNSWSSPCVQLWRIHRKILNRILPILGNFSRSCFRGKRSFCGC